MDIFIDLLLLVTGRTVMIGLLRTSSLNILTHLQQLIISPIEEILTIAAITIGTPTEIIRLYFGYSGNLREQVKAFFCCGFVVVFA